MPKVYEPHPAVATEVAGAAALNVRKLQGNSKELAGGQEMPARKLRGQTDALTSGFGSD
jgi:hypothetical protein